MIAGVGILVRPAASALFGYLSVGRVARAAFPVAFVVVVADGRGFAAAALLQGLMVAAFAGTAPLRARILERLGPRVALIPQTVVYLAALSALTVATVTSTGNNGLVAAFALIAGVTAPAFDPAVRLSWQNTARDDDEKRLLQLADSLLEEAGFLVGPVAASVLMLSAGLSSSLVVITAVVCVNNAAILLTPAVRNNLLRDREPALAKPDQGPAPDRSARVSSLVQMVLGPIARPDLRQIVTPLVGMGTAFGLLAIAVPGMLGAGGDIEASGFVLAAISAGGIAGGLAYGALKLEGTLWRRQALLSVAFAVPILPVLFIRSPILLAVALAVAGLSVTPLYVNSYLLIDEVVSADVKQEASSWVPVGNEVGYIAGITAGGLLVWWGGFVPALTGVSIVGAVLVLVAARGLRPRRAPEPTVQPDAGQEAGRKAGREAVA